MILPYNSIKFYISYFYYRFMASLCEVRRNPLTFYTYSVIFLFHQLFKTKTPSKVFKSVYVKTKFGEFFLRPHTTDFLFAMPFYERQDLDYFIDSIRAELVSKQHVLFLDIGADIGTYTVSVGNMLKSYQKQVNIIAFEPTTSSYELLLKNLAANHLQSDWCKAYKLGISSKKTIGSINVDSDTPGSSFFNNFDQNVRISDSESVEMVDLDTFINDLNLDFNILFIKMDIEGHEIQALEGAKNILNIPKLKIFLQVEDFFDNTIIEYLRSHGFKFVHKITPYNSFWVKEN